MEQQAEITRDDLYHPKIAEPREIWTVPSDFTGALALWAVKQSSYPVPENLEVVLKTLHDRIEPHFDSEYAMRKFTTINEVEFFASEHLRAIPEYMAWNERKNGNDAPLSFISAYDGPRDPDNDFIDLGALERNVAMHIVQQSALL